MALTKNSQIDLNGNEMILDADGDTTITADTDDQIDFKTAGTDRVAIGASGNLFVGSSTSNGISDGTSGLQVSGAGFKGTISASRHDNNAYGSSLMLGKSRNTTVGSNTIVQDGDAIGAIGFFADDGTNLDSQVAYITASVDGTPGANDTPGRLTFSTTADGSAAASEIVRINSTGDFLVRQTASAVYDTNTGGDVRQYWGNQFSGANNTNSKIMIGSGSAIGLIGGATTNSASKFIVNSYMVFGQATATAGSEAGYIDFYTSTGGAAGTQKMRINGSGDVAIGSATDGTRLYVYDNSAGNYLGIFYHDGNDNDRYGLRMLAGSDSATTGQFWIRFDDGDGHAQGYIYHDSGSVVINQASDERLKENIVDSTLEGINTLKNIKQREFNWKRDADKTKVIGYIAQELESVYPAAVVINEDKSGEGITAPEDDPDNPYKYLLKERLIDVLIKATQEQQTIIEDLKARITTLEGG